MSVEKQSSGDVQSVPVERYKVFQRAYAQGATSIAIAHNHLSGNPIASMSDQLLTSAISDASNTLGLEFLDQIIFTQSKFFSVKEQKDYPRSDLEGINTPVADKFYFSYKKSLKPANCLATLLNLSKEHLDISVQSKLFPPEKLYQYLRTHLPIEQEEKECLCVFLDSRDKPIAIDKMFAGSMRQLALQKKPILKRALTLNATSFAICHNQVNPLEPAVVKDVKGLISAAMQLDLTFVNLIAINDIGARSQIRWHR